MRPFVGLLLALCALLTGCSATGPKFTEVEASFPNLKADTGRIYFYRTAGLGMAVQPDIRLNGDIVGQSQPNSFFFVDRPAGQYVASARTEAESTLDIHLRAGKSVYVQTSITMGLMVGRVSFSEQSESVARDHLPGLAYNGPVPVFAGPSRGPGTRPADEPPAAGTIRQGTARATTMDDLSGLLPPVK